MTIDLEKILQFKSKIKLEQIYNYLIGIIALLILVMASIALNRPVSTQQYSNVLKLADQQIYPQTQEMAELLSQQQSVSMLEYIRLMQAQQQESVRAHQLPDAVEDMPHRASDLD